MEINQKQAEALSALSKICVSPYHMVAEAKRQLAEKGYQELSLTEEWHLEPGQNYMLDVYQTTCIAFRVNPAFAPGQQFRLAAAHTDWPCLRIKPMPAQEAAGCRRLNVEVYGGPIYSSWFDRPLSIAGKVTCKGETPFKPECKLVDFGRPVVYLPNLAIHMNREANSGYAYNPQIDLLPIAGLADDAEKAEGDWFLQMLSAEVGVPAEDILGYDLYIYVQEEREFVGNRGELLSAPRIDNLTSCASCLVGLLDSYRQDGLDMIVLFDNEECGSKSKQGADSALLPLVLEKIGEGLSLTRQQQLNLIFGGIGLSVDVAHARHPSHPEKADPTTDVTLSPSVVVKLESNQRYATDSMAAGVVDGLCRQYGIPVTHFSNRSDVRGGSTLGSLVSSWLPMATVDIGVPILAMHSARELMAVESQHCMDWLLSAFFSCVIEKARI